FVIAWHSRDRDSLPIRRSFSSRYLCLFSASLASQHRVGALTVITTRNSAATHLEIAAVYPSYVVRVLVITGAGVSAESGIPTFRGKDGYWRNLDPIKLATAEAFERDPCGVVIVAGTPATFGYIIDWALRGSRRGGALIEVNPEEPPLSRFATRPVREPAAIALPRLANELPRK